MEPASFERKLAAILSADVKGYDYRSADGNVERLPTLAAEFVRLGPHVIVPTSTPAALAVKRATSTIPIVMVSPGELVSSGLVASLARPGGNITGLTLEITPRRRQNTSSSSRRSVRP